MDGLQLDLLGTGESEMDVAGLAFLTFMAQASKARANSRILNAT